MDSSELVIRPYEESDAAAIAELYNRYADVPNPVDRKLDAELVRGELAERGTRLFLVVEADGEIHGTIGFFQGHVRRAYAPGEVFGDMFFLSPALRGGSVAGRIFSQAIRTLRLAGVEVIRLTANPGNKLAFPLYRQVGCSVTGPVEATEDGNIELVSYMPRVMARLRRDYAHLIPQSLQLNASWRYMVGGGERALGDDTEELGGRTVLRTELAIEGTVFTVLLDPEDGELLHVGTDAEEAPALAPKPVPAPPAVSTVEADGLRLELHHGDGRIELHGAGHLGPLLRETWPVFGPPFVTGFRRALRREDALTVTPRADGWLVAERHPDGVLYRETTLVGGVLENRFRWEGGEPPADTLRTIVEGGLRKGLLLTEDGHVPAGRGLHPVDATEFATAGAELGRDARIGWWDEAASVGLDVLGGDARARLVTDALVLLDFAPGASGTPGHAHSVTVRTEWSGGAPMAADGMEPLAAQAAEPVVAPPPVLPVADRAAWTADTVARRPVHRAAVGADTLLVSAEAGGIAAWRSAGKSVLATPFPKERVLGSNPRWRAGLWAVRQGPREDPDRGLGWGAERHEWRFDEATGRLRADGLDWSVAAPADGPADRLDLDLRAEARDDESEVVVWLTPAAPRQPEALVPGRPGELWRIRKPGAWQRWSDRLALRLADGRWLSVAPGEGHGTEVFLRTTKAGPLVGLVARQPRGAALAARWSLTVLPGPAVDAPPRAGAAETAAGR
ncbi:GNAT family N-acetyltransferase [Streptomyces mobaraensis]|uniref:GNAT family N-acetyltransferase n=1 Tax=Streptomyces mobaraensis TaxID=35621 RepID=UPI0012ACB775|nr:GNAT family N-acetyltransferase [Streptomyces mobaraensis]